MKKIITLLVFCFAGGMVMAQTPALKVASSGNVGIGLDEPIQPLEIAGNVLIPNGSYYLAHRNPMATGGGGLQQAFGMDGNNDIIFNRSAITADATSGLIFGAADKWIDLRDKEGATLMRVREAWWRRMGRNF